RLPLEFSAPRALGLNTAASNLNELRRVAGARVPEMSAEGVADLGAAPARYRIGRSQRREGGLGEALFWFERALEADPHHVLALVGASETSLALKRPAVAREFAERAVKVEPGNAAALYAMGVALVQLYRSDEAVPILERAVAIAPREDAYRAALESASVR